VDRLSSVDDLFVRSVFLSVQSPSRDVALCLELLFKLCQIATVTSEPHERSSTNLGHWSGKMRGS